MTAGASRRSPDRASGRGAADQRPPHREPAGLAARRVAWTAIRRVHTDVAWASPAVDAALEASGLDARDRAFAANLAFETLRWEGTLDWLLGHVVRRPLPEVEPDLLDVLRLGAWQLRFGRVPDRAAVDTSVELARRHVGARTAGFVNGVLRALVRAGPPLPSGTDAESLGLRLGMPAWSVDLARQRFGPRADDVLAAGNEPPGLVLRVNVADDTAESSSARRPGAGRARLLEELRAEGIAAHLGRHPKAVHVPGGVAARIDAVRSGRATVQDEASMYVIDAVLDAAGSRDSAGALVIDVCAGPGGKTTGLQEAGARVVAVDRHASRARLVADLAQRDASPARASGLNPIDPSVVTLVGDAARPPLREAIADVVLVDAPCTGLGVVRRRPELRWRRTASDAARLAEVQRELLTASAALVRPGGALAYSVCTWPAEETREVVEAFLDAHPGWTPQRPAIDAGTVLDGDPGVQLAPDVDGTDGMYIAVLRRPV